VGMNGRGGITRGYRAGIFVNVVLICLLGLAAAIGAVALVRRLSWRHDLRFDVTRDARYELDPLVKNLLRGLDGPLEILFAWGYDREIQNRVLDGQGLPRSDLLEAFYDPILREASVRVLQVLHEWSRTTGHVSYRSFRVDDNPQRLADTARELGRPPEDLVNQVIMTRSGRRRAVPLRRMMQDMEWGYFPASPGPLRQEPRLPGAWRVHDELTATLRALLIHEPEPVHVLQSKEGVLEAGTPDWHRLRSLLEPEGYELVPFDPARSAPLEPRRGVLLIPAIRRRLEDRELAQLRAYDESGGRILAYVDPRHPETLPRLFERYGLEIRDGWLEDRSLRHPARRGAEDLQSARLCQGLHPIDSPLRGRVEIFAGPCRPLRVGRDAAPGALRVTLLAVTEAARTIPIAFEPGGFSVRTDPAAVAPTPPDDRAIAVALERPVAGAAGRSRAVVFGGASFLAPEELERATFFGNRDLLLNSLAWVTERQSHIGLLPRGEVSMRIVSLPRVERPAFWFSVVLLPGAATLIAILLAIGRRS
jgi:hypothetical protein